MSGFSATAGGAYLRVQAGAIHLHAPGKIELKASRHVWLGPACSEPERPAFWGRAALRGARRQREQRWRGVGPDQAHMTPSTETRVTPTLRLLLSDYRYAIVDRARVREAS